MFTEREIDALVAQRVEEALEVREILEQRAAELRMYAKRHDVELNEDQVVELITLDEEEFERGKQRVARFYAKGSRPAKPPGSGSMTHGEMGPCLAWCERRGLPFSRQALEQYRAAAGG